LLFSFISLLLWGGNWHYSLGKDCEKLLYSVCVCRATLCRSILVIYIFFCVCLFLMRCPLAGGSEWRMAPGPLASSRVSTPKLLLLLTLPNFFCFF
jgi:hypothetical protein